MNSQLPTSYILWGLSRCYLAFLRWDLTIVPVINDVGLSRILRKVALWKLPKYGEFGAPPRSQCATHVSPFYSFNDNSRQWKKCDKEFLHRCHNDSLGVPRLAVGRHGLGKFANMASLAPHWGHWALW